MDTFTLCLHDVADFRFSYPRMILTGPHNDPISSYIGSPGWVSTVDMQWFVVRVVLHGHPPSKVSGSGRHRWVHPRRMLPWGPLIPPFIPHWFLPGGSCRTRVQGSWSAFVRSRTSFVHTPCNDSALQLLRIHWFLSGTHGWTPAHVFVLSRYGYPGRGS